MLDSIYSDIKKVLKITWPMLLISVVLLVSLRVAYIITQKKKVIWYQEILFLCFSLYIICLFQIVTTQDINALQGNNFTPFKELFRYSFGSRLFIRNVIGNMLLFLPYGFFANYFIKNKKAIVAFLLILIASLSIELTQLAIGRVFDVDDILLNLFGGMLGFFIYFLIKKIKYRR